jgi:hypothetical protein
VESGIVEPPTALQFPRSALAFCINPDSSAVTIVTRLKPFLIVGALDSSFYVL